MRLHAAPVIPKTSRWKNLGLLVLERAGKALYWSSPLLRQAFGRYRRRAQPSMACNRHDLRDYLQSIGVARGALVMAHTSVSGVEIREEGESPGSRNAPLTAIRLLDDLLTLLGHDGTLVMPTHAVYQTDPDVIRRLRRGQPERYDPAATPTNSGLVNEFFRRRPGVQRSLHPWNMVAACGPLASDLLDGNLNDRKPLPHGVDSAYYRVCERDGLVISVGIPLARYLTLGYVAEEVRDREWPIRGFFEELSYLVRIDGRFEPYVVRQSRPEYHMLCRCNNSIVRDLCGEGVVRTGRVGSVPVDWARAADIFDYFMRRNQHAPYPYFMPRWIWKCG